MSSLNWQALKSRLVAAHHPALVAEKFSSFAARRSWHTLVSWLTALSGLAALVFAPALHFFGSSAAGSATGTLDIRLLGFFFLFLDAWILSACFRAVHYYYAVDEQGSVDAFELARILYHSSVADPVRDFLRQPLPRLMLARIGASPTDIENFLNNRPVIIPASSFSFPDSNIGISDYLKELMRANTQFAHFIASFGVTLADMSAVVDWVLTAEARVVDAERWWSRARLGRVRGIGKTWSYGRLNELEKYQRTLPPAAQAFYGTKELAALEDVLRRSRQANCFLVGDNPDEKTGIISKLDELIEEGRVMPELEHKQIVVLDTDLIIGAAKTMSDFERLVRKLGDEAAGIGNIILVFLDFPAFLAAGTGYGLDVAAVLDPFFTAPELQIIALASVQPYEALIEKNPALAQRFGTVLLEETGAESTLRALQDALPPIEGRHNTFFTYQAVRALVEGGDRYIVSGLQPEKSLSLLQEFAPRISTADKSTGKKKMFTIVQREDVEDFLRAKTGIPMGAVNEGERARLLNLETILHQRIIGQDEAVNAISAAVRRARSGINNPDRPIASFLFLGPTGVGKTETTKALADVFFGQGAIASKNPQASGEASIERLDMSEYSSGDALEKLIGTHGGNQNSQGILADMVREHPYGVLLLDEFEKTTPEVMNLFLQVLDEGFFSDGQGVKVNCRNLLIIATSNAGAEMIWDAVKKGNDLSHSRELILDALIHQGMFRPELINRFDGVIIFHPLAREHLEKVARLQLQKLAERLAARGLNLKITNDLVQYVMQFGTDPKFGARPMNRAIADTVEQAVADKMIAGKLPSGSDIELTAADLAAVHRS